MNNFQQDVFDFYNEDGNNKDNIEIDNNLQRYLYGLPNDYEKINDRSDCSNISFGNNNKIHNSFANNTTIDINKEKIIFDISFFTNNNNEDNNVKNKELKKETIEILSNFISEENLSESNNDIIEKAINNKNAYNITNIKKNLFYLDNKINLYFKNPYMRNNFEKLNQINLKNVYKEEKGKSNEGTIKMKNIKDCNIQE